MTAKEQAEKAKCVYELNGIIIYEYGFSSEEFKAFCEALCRDFNGFMIEKHEQDPTQIPMIDDVIDEFLKDKL